MPDISPNQENELILAVRELLGPGGRLAQAWSGYESRAGQLRMAVETARAFGQQDIALVEAGTGVGKTLAYLIPALLSGLRTVVSTGTKNLQEQIFYKDLPFIRQHLGSGFQAAYLKGRENYLCLHFYKIFLAQPSFVVPGEAVYLEALKAWAAGTETGDRAELADFPEDFATWTELSAPGERCLGRKCPEFGDCFLWQARRKAAVADLVVVNHHLFMADLAVRQGGFGEVIPEYEAVVFDEAHLLENVATQYFGLSVSSWRLNRIKRDVETALKRTGKYTPVLDRPLSSIGHQADTLARRFFLKDEEVELWRGDHPDFEPLRELGLKVVADLDHLAGQLEKTAGQDEELSGLAERSKTISSDLIDILEAADSSFVYYAERRGHGLFLRSSPIDVSPFLQESLYQPGRPLLFTSATLAAGSDFSYYKQRLGLLPEIEGVVVDSPFDYDRQTLLYVPRDLPHPLSQTYLPTLIKEIERLLNLSQGRAFVLFTSHRNLNYAAEILADRLPWTCLVQGEAPRTALLERFRRDTASVLLATHSFWQGVDVPGESLSSVIIDKLPFPRPDRPLVKARSARLKEEGRDPFFQYMIPDTIITLKQGLGRLIRSRDDRGLLAVLDSRLVTKGYGKKFLRSLPGQRLTHDLGEVANFFKPVPD